MKPPEAINENTRTDSQFFLKNHDKKTAVENNPPKSDQNKMEKTDSRYLAAIVEFCEDAIISKSLDGIIETWNKGSEKMFGYTAKEVIGKHISLIIPAKYRLDEKKIISEICNDQTIDHYETVRKKKTVHSLTFR